MTASFSHEPTELDPSHGEMQSLVGEFATEAMDGISALFRQSEQPADLLSFLAVGSCLRELGYAIAVKAGTSSDPLWHVAGRGTTPAFFVDVVPINLSPDELVEFRVSSHLVETLQSIPINQRLHMEVTDYRRFVETEAREQIVAKTREWLEANSPSGGDHLQFSGGSLTVMPWDKPRDHLAVIGPAFSYWIRKLEIDNLLEERVRTNSEIAVEHPYVLAAVAPERVGLSRRCYSELLTAHPEEPERSDSTLTDEVDRQPLFSSHSEISAATWVWKSSRGIWEMKAIHNPAALHQLPEDSLDL